MSPVSETNSRRASIVRALAQKKPWLIEIEEMAPAFALPKSTPVVTDHR
jgi:hypothetical protein